MIDQKVIEAVEAFKNGSVVVFPTDTVWGIGASVDRLAALRRLYKVKKREKSKPTAVLVDSMRTAMMYGEFFKPAVSLARKHWPGGLTIVVPATRGISEFLVSERGTVGLRVPDHKFLLAVLGGLGVGIAAGSANFEGQPAPKQFDFIDRRLLDLVDWVVEPGVGLESGGRDSSTVVEVSGKQSKVLREGPVDVSKLE